MKALFLLAYIGFLLLNFSLLTTVLTLAITNIVLGIILEPERL